MNLVYFRGELQGVRASSELLFGKRPSNLSASEAWVLASLIRSPNQNVDTLKKRSCLVASRFVATKNPDAFSGLSVCQETDHAAGKVGSKNIQSRVGLAPHFASMLSRHNKERWIQTSIDRSLQNHVIDIATQQMHWLSRKNAHDVAVVILENSTGEIISYLGNVASLSSARFNDGVLAKRQAGSTLKPFLYGLAFEKNLLTDSTLLLDDPLEIDTGRGIYRPENYDKVFRGAVPVRLALASSLNVPAVKVLELVGIDSFVKTLTRYGFEDLLGPEDYGPSLALGTADVSLLELTRAYRFLAIGEGGLSKESSNAVAEILSDREARAATFGLESPLSTRSWSAVKTGTSKDMRDNWCMGWSNRYTVGVWVGNFNGEPMWNVSGVSGAAPIWSEIMNLLHRSRPSEIPAAVSALASLRRNTSAEVAVSDIHLVRITSPAKGSTISLDPDIPASRQKMLFKASATENSKWILNGREFGSASKSLLWQPVPGKHRLGLLSDSRIRDLVEFTVRK